MSKDNRELRRVTPFAVQVEIRFDPHNRMSAYQVSATGKAEINGTIQEVRVMPSVSLISAQWLCDLQFSIHVDANALLPFVNEANKSNGGNT